jgi:hypothetical protein
VERPEIVFENETLGVNMKLRFDFWVYDFGMVEVTRLIAAMTSPRQHAPRGLRMSQAQRPAAMCARMRSTADDWPRVSISARHHF